MGGASATGALRATKRARVTHYTPATFGVTSGPHHADHAQRGHHGKRASPSHQRRARPLSLLRRARLPSLLRGGRPSWARLRFRTCPGRPAARGCSKGGMEGESAALLIFRSVLDQRDWYFIAVQPAPAPHLAHPKECAALRIVLLTVRSCTFYETVDTACSGNELWLDFVCVKLWPAFPRGGRWRQGH